MNTFNLAYGWTLHAPKVLSVLTNEFGEVGILYSEKNFGDTQALLLHLSEETLSMNSIPHHIEKVEVSLKKVITISLSQFIIEWEKENKTLK
ncbi:MULTISPECIES: hypothetical protein [Carnobacterium]|uniref:hypothetical protein n=1 Tax=Carnobacterium TaxID=2747 RepID=UPI0028913F5C|nr:MULTISPECIES: hypothetical protein [Carnobacterium]MDT1938582.1 hypothetical protein [Carnobacterium divergens]MDT1941020.1 hypothetical protein [Carnobacterium divergens]MDT1946818.1 hypothetical protein [Carnobacterium divergens]MDT1949255.1 hypothetical protein [Carnobacterium divergens]MDT1954433.1 hypothetical protein [Carnobacterium divergens]